MKKYKRHEVYPDPIVRKYIESNISMGLTNDQILNFSINQLPHLIEIKNEMKLGVSMLFEAKEQIYKSLMLHSLFKNKFMNP
mmetsp:Transcript_13557/g.15712  ORF Transcript_13557/g.15712 Transcript_13557/m.15712 type:complete len:82 (+) Transcript_13557:496-741(+)